MKILIIGIAAVAHSINAAYCRAIGDETQVDWADAPEWQQQSAIAGVEMHLANPDATPEQSHESWLKQKLDDGWVYGETKDAEAKQHPCCVPFAELSAEQKAKDYIFRAAVHAAKALVDGLPKPEQVKEVVVQAAGFTANQVSIQYIGAHSEWLDHIYSTSLHFTKDQVRAMPAHFAHKFLRHPDMFVLVDAQSAVDDQDTLQVIDDAQHKADEAEQSNTREYDMIAQINNMSREGMIEHAEKHYQVKLKGREAAIRTELTQLVNRFGAL